MKSSSLLVFVAAGGRGERLWSKYPKIKKSGLPKSLSIFIKGKPLISYQLQGFLKIPNCRIILSFNNQYSIKMFNKYLSEGKIPKGDYYLNMHSGDPDMKHVDMLRGSQPHRLWEDKFKKIFITSGDVFTGSKHPANILALSDKENCSVFTIAKFPDYQARLLNHYHLIIKNGNLLNITRGKRLPRLALWHPYIFTMDVFNKYIGQPVGSSKPDFVSQLLHDNIKIKVVEPDYYYNVNCPRDLEDLNYFVNKITRGKINK